MNSVNGDHTDGLALSGVSVLDLTHQVAGPSATLALAPVGGAVRTNG